MVEWWRCWRNSEFVYGGGGGGGWGLWNALMATSVICIYNHTYMCMHLYVYYNMIQCCEF